MSAPKALRATSLRDSLAKTVRLLTKQGIDVQFRGHQPFVQTKGNKATRLVLPELNDNAPAELIEALQGFLDHEVGHIFYTPFARASKFTDGNRTRHSLCNIIEDIRLEKLLPRDLPGTKENLERMYDSVMDTFFGKVALEANNPKTSKNEAFSCVMVCAMRALAGQKAFQKFMDGNNLWPHFMPLVKKMPNISRRLRDLEDFTDVERLVEDILEALKPPPPPAEEKDENEPAQQKPKKSDQDSNDVSIDPDADDSKDDGASDDNPDGDDQKSDDEEDSDDGEGHGDGKGTDDGNPDDEEEGKSKGSESDEDSDDEGAGTKDGEHESDEGDEEGDRDEGDVDEEGAAGEGKSNRSLRDALALLEPKHRRALFLYKKKRQTVAQIADDLEVSEEETRDMLAQARRQVREFLNGG